jgi:hypothetical protein
MAPPPEKNPLHRTAWLAAILMTIAAVWLHFYFLFHAGGLWRDEVCVVNIATLPSLGQVWEALPHDHCPILFPALVRVWAASGWGANANGLRVLGMGVGLLLLALFWVAARMMGKRPPLLSLGLAALNFTIIRYGDSIRAYGLGTACILLTTMLVWRFVEAPNTRCWLLAGLAAVLSVQALYQNAFFVLAVCIAGAIVCILRRERRSVFGLLGIGLAAALSLLPYVTSIYRAQTWWVVSKTGISLPFLRERFAAATGGLMNLWLILVPLAVLIGFYPFFTTRRHDETHHQRDLSLFAGTALVIGLAGFGIFVGLSGLPTEPWYYIPALAFAVVCCDAILSSGHPITRVGVLIAAIVSALCAYPAAHSDLSHRFTNMDALARRLQSEAAPKDFIIVTPWYCGISFEYYFKGATPWTTLPPLADYSWHRYDLVKIQMQKTNAIRPVFDQITATLHAGNRVWVLADAGWMDIPDPGTQSPYNLPPAPLKSTGWLDLPYIMEWCSQTAHFLGNHSRRFERVQAPTTGSSSVGENLELFVASGWEDSNQPVSTPDSETNKP